MIDRSRAARQGALALVLAGLAAMPPAYAQGNPTRVYEAQWRDRGAVLVCLKGEDMHGPFCVKPCQDGFRLEVDSRPPKCVATRPDARYTPPAARQPQYQTPEKALPHGAKGT
jgi:hypothetical protein